MVGEHCGRRGVVRGCVMCCVEGVCVCVCVCRCMCGVLKWCCGVVWVIWCHAVYDVWCCDIVLWSALWYNVEI